MPALPDDERRKIRYEFHGFGHDAHVRAFDEIYRVITDEIDPERVIDATVASGRPDYFVDHIHPTRLGARRIAEIVSTYLLQAMDAAARPSQD